MALNLFLAVFGSPLLVSLFVLLLGLASGLLFLFATAVGVWLGAAAWAAALGTPDSDESGFDESQLLAPLAIAGVAIGEAIESLVAIGVTAAQSAGAAVLGNPILTAVAIALFAFVFVWTQFHAQLLVAAAGFYNCFFAPLWRTLVVPLIELAAFVVTTVVLPLLVALRRIIVSVTTSAALRALEASFDAVAAAVAGVLTAAQMAALALVAWLRVDAGGGSPLVVGPNLVPAATVLGNSVADLSAFGDALCEPLAEPLIDPLFDVWRAPALPLALNATAGVVPAFVTQVIARPIVDSLRNRAAQPDAPLSETIQRPNFNASIDLVLIAVRNYTEFGDSFISAGFEASLNLLRDLTGLPLPAEPRFPTRSYLTLMLAAPTEIFVLQPAKIVLNLLTNIDVVFMTSDGFLFWRLDDVYDAVRDYAGVAGDPLRFASAWLNELADEVRTLARAPVGADDGILPSLRGIDVRRINDTLLQVDADERAAPLALEGEILSDGLRFIASSFDTTPFIISSIAEALIQATRLVPELLVGTIYTTIAELEASATPNPLRFAQRYFGDDGQGAFRCSVGSAFGGLFQIVFSRASVRDCIESNQFKALCDETASTGVVPDIVFTDNAFRIEAPQGVLDLIEANCAPTPDACVSSVRAENDEPRNEFRVAYDAFVAPVQFAARQVDELVEPVASFVQLERIVRSAGAVLVDVAIVVTDLLTHPDRIVTTAYLGQCVDFDAVLDDVEQLATSVADSVRAFEEQFANVPQNSCTDLSSRFFCCAANAIESFTALIVEPARFVLASFRAVIEAIRLVDVGEDESERLDELFDSLSFEPTFAAVDSLVKDATCVVLQVVPGDIPCTGAPDTFVRDELVDAVSNTLSELLLLVPRVTLNGVLEFVNLLRAIIEGADDSFALGRAVNNFIVVVAEPFITLATDALRGGGSLLQCADPNTGLGGALIDLAEFADELAGEVIALLADFLLLGLQLVFGLFELIFNTCGEDGPCTTLLTDAGDTLALIFSEVVLLIFGSGFVCGVVDAGCQFGLEPSVGFVRSCDSNGFEFRHCRLNPGRLSEGFCDFVDGPSCFFGGCPDAPFGCCTDVDFPELNSADGLDELLSPVTSAIERISCRPWVGVDVDDDTDTDFMEDCRAIVGTPAGQPVEPYTTYFFDNSTLERLACSFGQSSSLSCPLFSQINECREPEMVLIPRDGSDSRKRDVHKYERIDYEEHRGRPLSAAYCAGWLEEYGMARARTLSASGVKYRQIESADDRAALRCYRAMLRDFELPHEFLKMQAERNKQMALQWRRFVSPRILIASFADSLNAVRPAAERAVAARAQRRTLSSGRRARRHYKLDLGLRVRGFVAALRIATAQHHAHVETHMRDVARPLTARVVSAVGRYTMHREKFASLRANRLLTHVVSAVMHASDVMEHGVHSAHSALHAAPRAATAIVAGHARAVSARGASLLAVRDLAMLYGRRLDAGLRARLDAWSRPHAPPRRRVRKKAVGARRIAPLQVTLPPNTLPALGVHQCDANAQVVCTGCALVDDLIFEGESAVNRTADFYTAEGGGYGLVLEQFNRTIDRTLVDPAGSDTFATADKRTPFILERLFSVRWFWQWDYSEFRDIVNGALDGGGVGGDDLADETERESERVAAEAGRDDLDNAVYEVIKPIVRPAVNFLESLVASVGVTDALNIAGALAERYLICDYDRAMYCEEPASVGLFDGLANMALLFLIVGLLVSALPGSLIIFAAVSMFAGTVFVYGTLWIAYGASPLCTLPSLVGGVGALPTCTLMDASQLLQEVTPECPFLPPALIAPGDPNANELCTTCGATPAVRSCAEAAGFLDGRDNLFFSLASIFPQAVVDQVGATLDILVSGSAAVAARYTPALLASLRAAGQIGATCNLITLGNLVTLAAVVALAALVATALVALLAGLGAALVVLTFAVLYVVVLLYQQQYIGLVLRTGDRKLKLA